MSSVSYGELWRETQAFLDDLVIREMTASSAAAEHNKCSAKDTVLDLYLRHMLVLGKLGVCYDHIIQPQKRLVIRKILDAVIGRLIELKQELTWLDVMEYHCLDHLLMDLRMSPEDACMPVPAYFRVDRRQTLRDLAITIQTALEKARLEADGADEESVVCELGRELAVRLIQRHERARQGRLRARISHDTRIKLLRERNRGKRVLTMGETEAAVKIQTVWRGFWDRRRVDKMRIEEMVFLGMLPSYSRGTSVRDPKLADELRRHEQKEKQLEYDAAQISVKSALKRDEADGIRKELETQIRDWFHGEWHRSGRFPVFPSEEDGGSAALFDPNFVPTVRPARDDKKVKSKGRRYKETTQKLQQEKKRTKKTEEEDGFSLQPSKFIDTIVDGCNYYNDVWKLRDESDIFNQGVDVELVRDEKRYDVTCAIRRDVDVTMRQELDSLKDAAERDRGKRHKKKKKKKGKKRRGGKKSKRKRTKDLTSDRSMESLVEELAAAGVLKLAEDRSVTEFSGYPSLTGSALRSMKQQPTPQLGDLRRIVTEYCILPLGCTSAHELAPAVKSVLIAGPSGCGKSLLLEAICSETGSVLVDLSAANIAGKYPGKSGITMLMHLVNKVGRALQPTVVCIDNAEKTFVRKVAKTDRTEPRRLKKELPKFIKGISPQDRLLLVGMSATPWEAEQKALGLVYQRMLLVPPLDYASRLQLLTRHVHVPHVARHPCLSLSVLTKLSAGYTTGACIQMVNEVLTEQRIVKLRKRPLKTSEFIPVLSTIQPVMRDQQEAFDLWLCKTPLGRKRSRMLEADAALAKFTKSKRPA